MEGSGKSFHLTAESESATVSSLTEISKTHHTQEHKMTAKQPWFTVDKAGLAKIVARKGIGPLIRGIGAPMVRAAIEHPGVFE